MRRQCLFLPGLRRPIAHPARASAAPPSWLRGSLLARQLSARSRASATSTAPAAPSAIAVPRAAPVPAPENPSLPRWIAKLPPKPRAYVLLARLDKPIGTWLLYLPCTWSIGMAAYAGGVAAAPTLGMMALFGTGAVVMRSAGCTINDMWDRDLDAQVARTTLRPLANGSLTRREALGFLAVQLGVGLAVLTQLNAYSIALGAVSLVPVTVYPLMKRITYYPQVVLGIAFNWGAFLGWAALLGQDGMSWQVTGPLYLSGVVWTVIYDTLYAHQDKVDDAKAGIWSTARKYGDNTKPFLYKLTALQLGLLVVAGLYNDQGWPFYTISCGGALAQLLYMIRAVNLDDPRSCWLWFRRSRLAGYLILIGILTDWALE